MKILVTRCLVLFNCVTIDSHKCSLVINEYSKYIFSNLNKIYGLIFIPDLRKTKTKLNYLRNLSVQVFVQQIKFIILAILSAANIIAITKLNFSGVS